MAPERIEVEVGERTLSLSNLDKVMYPDVGFTKSQVIDYYVRIAPVLLPHIEDRGVTLIRFPDGVDGKSFFSKRCVDHRPDWVSVAIGPGNSDGEPIKYCRLSEVAALAWTANLAALEIHGPMARCDDIETPTMVVFDLDPGPNTTLIECCQVALDIKGLMDQLGLQLWPKTSGSKGMQLYLPLNTPHSHAHASGFALAVAQLLERQQPKKVVSRMTKSLREGRVFVDWSQNSRHKTTVSPYSLRARSEPRASTPITWDEVSAGADGDADSLFFVAEQVLERVQEDGDLFAPTLTVEQVLPDPS